MMPWVRGAWRLLPRLRSLPLPWWRSPGAAVLLSMLLVSCATVRRIDDGVADAFSRTGRFALTVQTPDAPPQATQGGFAWHDDGRVLRVNLTNPVGSVLAQLRVAPERAVLVRGHEDEEAAQDPDALAARVLGRAVPVARLRTWLRAQVSLQATDVEHDDQGRVSAFTQDGWRVRWSRFDAHGPRVLRLTRSDAPGQHVQLRLVIDSAS